MTFFARPLKSIAVWGSGILLRANAVLIAIMILGLGTLLGFLFKSPGSAELTISVLVIFVVMLVIVHTPLYGVLLWLVLDPFIGEWINIPMGAGIPDLEYSRFIIAFLAIVMLARAATGKSKIARIGLAEVCIVFTTIGIMISASLADDPKDALQLAISMHFVPLSAYFFTKNLVQNEEDLHKLLMAIVIFGFAAASYAVFEQATGNILFLPKGESADEVVTAYSENLWQLQGLLGRSAHFGRVLAASIPITFYLFFETKTTTRKVLLVGMLAVQAYGMFLTYNRTSWYALLISLTILQFFYPQFRRVYIVIVLVAAVGLWATWDQVNDSTVVQERVNEKTQSFNGRSERWAAGLNMWKAKPIRGWGFGRFQEESGRFRTDGSPYNLWAIENDYLHILVSCGLLGFLPYALFLLAPLFNGLRLFFRARGPDRSGFIKPEMVAVYFAVILAFIIGSYTQMQVQSIVKTIPFAVAGAVVGTHEYLLRSSKAEKRIIQVANSQI